VKPGKGGAFVRTKVRDIATGAVLDKTFRAGEKFERMHTQSRKLTSSTPPRTRSCSWTTTPTSRSPSRPTLVAKDALEWAVEVEVYYLNGEPFDVQAPTSVKLVITQSDPGVQGNTAQGATKPATLETGVAIQVPLFIEGKSRSRHAHQGVPGPRLSACGAGDLGLLRRAEYVADTDLRDGHQSLWATRMRTTEMLPILETMDEVGYNSLECSSRPTFDASLRFLDEDPWGASASGGARGAHPAADAAARPKPGRLPALRRATSCAVSSYKAAENGVDIFRVFDALNDIRNFETAASRPSRAGKHFRRRWCTPSPPVHSLDHYLEVAHKLVDIGADSIIKDMAALLPPSTPSSSSAGWR